MTQEAAFLQGILDSPDDDAVRLDDPRDVQRGAIRLTFRDRQIHLSVLIRRTEDGPAVVLTF